MITMAFGALYQIADGLFVGRFIGEDALAAVNLIMPIIKALNTRGIKFEFSISPQIKKHTLVGFKQLIVFCKCSNLQSI